ncbi:carbohydrate sulfotransferase 11-like isoform X2 [Lytechinus variegatus]|uniref:carbohydrate sulfotransferase 11-like isoform X2 n=1 Tax=Lytechinus variegatus TaxID=7654 RepID=UPI001BB25C5F|nr:carbohydrate sulfotransferase 11-like isoform X2 [Lytechinus variegatus]
MQYLIMPNYKQSKLLLIGTILLVAMVSSYSLISPNLLKEIIIQKSSKAEPPKSNFTPIAEVVSRGNATFHSEVIQDAFIHSQKVIQKERQNRIINVCEKYHMTSRDDVINKPPFNIIVDHNHKVIFCFVPKVACTSWKRIFLVLKGIISDTDEINQHDINHHEQKNLDFFFRQTRQMRRHILESYTKIMFARHPMSRVLSAYTNKLSPNSTFSGAKGWQRGLGNRILKHFYPTSTHKTYDLTFGDFVKYLGEEHEGDGDSKGRDNKHWKEIYKMCSPCSINYDIIGKIETMSRDVEFVLKSLHISDMVKFPSSSGSSPTNSSSHIIPYYTKIPTEDVIRLYERYRLDFEMFGYDIPNEIQLK